MIELLRV